MTPDGEAPDDNPFDGSLVYSLGHRNSQGLAWDASGQLYATEFAPTPQTSSIASKRVRTTGGPP